MWEIKEVNEVVLVAVMPAGMTEEEFRKIYLDCEEDEVVHPSTLRSLFYQYIEDYLKLTPLSVSIGREQVLVEVRFARGSVVLVKKDRHDRVFTPSYLSDQKTIQFLEACVDESSPIASNLSYPRLKSN